MHWRFLFAFLMPALASAGNTVLLESFDMGAPPSTAVGSAGAYGGATSKGWMSTWTVREGGAKFQKEGLDLPGLSSAGGSIRLQDKTTLVRQLGVSIEGTAYGSFRVKVPKLSDNCIVALLFGLPNTADLTPKTALASLVVKGWRSPRGAIGDGGNVSPIQQGEGIPAGSNVLVLWKMDGLPPVGRKGDHSIEMWILNADQAAHFAAQGMREADLRDARSGPDATQVLQYKRVYTHGSKFTLVRGLAVGLTVKFGRNVSFDEICISRESLADAAGLAPPGAGASPSPEPHASSTANAAAPGPVVDTPAAGRPNVLLITVDDMNWDSLGETGCTLPDISPHIDGLATGGLRLDQAYVQAPSCSPSRNALQSGRYPHTSGVIGFFDVDHKYAVLPELLRQNGYFTGIVNKVEDTTPDSDFARYWDYTGGFVREEKRRAALYFSRTAALISAAKTAGRPFYAVVNVADPHEPFFDDAGLVKKGEPQSMPSRVYSTDEVVIPGFLPNAPGIRQDVRNYYCSVKRADDCVGQVLAALHASGLEAGTVVMFVSDHGMPMPFAKSSLYRNGIRTPWIIRWPGKVSPATVDKDDMVEAIDFLPTVLDIAGIAVPEGVQGRSFLPILMGKRGAGRDRIFAEFHENAGGVPRPMRTVQSQRYGYHFNAWATGDVDFKSAATWDLTYKVMHELAGQDTAVATRFNFWVKRCVEELYDYEKDPDALHNLIDDPRYADLAASMRSELEAWMRETNDPLLPVYLARNEPGRLAAYMAQADAESLERARTLHWKRPTNRAGSTKGHDALANSGQPAHATAQSL